MASSKENGADEENNATSDYYKHHHNACTKTPGPIRPDQFYSTHIQKTCEQFDREEDNFDDRFMEQVYKERDTSDGWDRYLDILQQHLQSNNAEKATNSKNTDVLIGVDRGEIDCGDTDDSDKVVNWQDLWSDRKATSLNLGLSSDAHHYASQQKMKSSCCSTHQSSHDKGAVSHEKGVKSEKYKEIDGQRDVHYFRNGKYYYGNPNEHTDKATKQKKVNTGLDPSELQFYSNLRTYFAAAEENIQKIPSKAKSPENSSCKQERTTSMQNLSNHNKRKAPLPNHLHTKQNENVSKDTIEEFLPSGIDNVIQSANIANGGLGQSSLSKSTEQINKLSSKEENEGTCLIKKQNQTSQNKESSPMASCKESLSNEHKCCDLSSHSRNKENYKQNENCCQKEEVIGNTTQKFNSDKGSEESTANKEKPAFIRVTKMHSSNQKDEKSKKESVLSGINPCSSTQEKSADNTSATCETDICTPEKNSVHDASLSSPIDDKLKSKSGLSHVDSCYSACHQETQTSPPVNMWEHSPQTFQSEKVPKERSTNVKKTTNSSHIKNKSSTESEKESFVKAKDEPQKEEVSKSSSSKQEEVNSQDGFRRTKKSQRTTNPSSHSSYRTASTSKLQRDRKLRHKISESGNERHVPEIGRFARMSKDEMIGRISANEAFESLVKRFLYSVKEISIKGFYGLLWVLYYSILIIAIILLSLCVFGKAVVLYLYGHMITWDVTVKVINKLWLVKLSIMHRYNSVKEFIRVKIYGPKREAQTYNLPNTGEEAVQQLLVRQGPDNNPYRILGVPRDASDEDIRKQYRKFAVLVHPDKNKHLHSDKAFQILSSAYEVLGDVEKRKEYDRELARREQVKENPGFMKNPEDYTNPEEFFADFMKQMDELRECLACSACQGRHRRIATGRSVIQARFCYDCNTMHQAKEGDFWKESRFLGIANGKFYTRTHDVIYDITEWGLCQERCGFQLPADVHKVVGKIASRPPPRQRFSEADFFRDVFGHPNGDGRQYTHRENKQKQQQKSRRRKKK